MNYVYFLKCGADRYKVGISSDVTGRIRSLQTSNFDKIDLVACRPVDEAAKLEASIHSFLREYRGNGGREWFSLTPEQAIDVAIQINLGPVLKIADFQVVAESLLSEVQREHGQLMKTLHAIGTGLLQNRDPIDAETNKKIAQTLGLPAKERAKRDAIKDDEELEAVAIAIFEGAGGASASLLQRKLSIGYAKAARVVDNLEDKGYIGPPVKGSRTRKLISR